jgi:hypothetical protein
VCGVSVACHGVGVLSCSRGILWCGCLCGGACRGCGLVVVLLLRYGVLLRDHLYSQVSDASSELQHGDPVRHFMLCFIVHRAGQYPDVVIPHHVNQPLVAILVILQLAHPCRCSIVPGGSHWAMPDNAYRI